MHVWHDVGKNKSSHHCSWSTEPSREICWEGDSSGVRSGHDSVQGAEAAWEPGAAEVRWRGHHRGYQVPAGEAGRECAGS